MNLDHYVDSVTEQMQAAAALGDESTRQVAERLATAAAPAVRLALLTALGAAADEITAALLDVPGSPAVSVSLDGGQVAVEVRADLGDAPPPPLRADDGDATARISLRLSEALKSDVEAAAAAASVSVNTWLVRAASAALSGADHGFDVGPGRRRGQSAHRLTGWVNG